MYKRFYQNIFAELSGKHDRTVSLLCTAQIPAFQVILCDRQESLKLGQVLMVFPKLVLCRICVYTSLKMYKMPHISIFASTAHLEQS